VVEQVLVLEMELAEDLVVVADLLLLIRLQQVR
jgi:hypothetical protein